MTLRSLLLPTRRPFKPVLADEPIVDTGETAVNIFYTPAAQDVARLMDLLIAGAAGGSLLTAWVLSMTHGPVPLVNLFVFLAFVIAGVPALPDMWGKLRAYSIDIDFLMLLGACLAAYIGSPFEGALLLFLFALSGALEDFALRRTQSAIVALRALSPTEANLIDGETVRRVPLRQLKPGQVVLVRPGEKIPIDGEVVAGASSVDEAAITGESLPRDCGPGDAVFAGTQNTDGRLEIRVTHLAADTTLARIIKLVTDARHHPARAQRLIDRIGPTYSAVVILSAVAVGLVGWAVFGLAGNEAVRRGIALLIVASPCALIIATPAAYLSGMAASARRGVLVKGGSHLETTARAGVFVFDKTGTLTTGRIRMTDIEMNGAVSREETLRIVAGVESSSSHPLAAAVVAAARQEGLQPVAVDEFRSSPGAGESAVVNGRRVWIGRPELVHEHADAKDVEAILSRSRALREQGKTVSVVVLGADVGLLAFADTIRDEAHACVRQLRRQGVRRVDMLTGDHEIVARRVADDLQLDGFLAELKPEDKVSAVERLKAQYGAIVLVGDGINDAPALARADVGVAMGSIGAEIALEAADVVVMKDRIERVAWLHAHALRTAAIVRQNLVFAIGVIATLSVFSVLGSVPLPLAVVGHEGSTVLVALNALRLLQSRRDGREVAAVPAFDVEPSSAEPA